MSTRSLVSPEASKRFDVLRTLLVVFVIGIHAEKGLQRARTDFPQSREARQIGEVYQRVWAQVK